MARVHHVKAARKPIKSAGIKKGDSYYWWKFRYGAKEFAEDYRKHTPNASDGDISEAYDAAVIELLEQAISEAQSAERPS